MVGDSDLMAFPVSLPNDGLIDIEIMANVGGLYIPLMMMFLTMFPLPQSSRADIIGATDGASVGKNYWHPKVCSSANRSESAYHLSSL